jgi:cytochrome c-type biogenesis protein CcmH/NrfF
MSETRQTQYFNLIDELLRCPNGQEPEILESQPELVDSGLIHTMLQVATMFAHEGNQDGAQFLFFIARELAKQLGLYPDLSNEVATQE